MPPASPAEKGPSDAPRSGRLLKLPLPESDAGLVRALRAGREDAREELVRRTGDDVERVLYRILGPDPEISDLVHDVFVVALGSLHQLRDADALRSWLVGIAVRKGRKLIQRRRRWTFILSVAPSDLPERQAPTPSAEVSEALRAVYRVLASLPVDERIAFALRHVDGMDLVSVSEAMKLSLATVKRRLARAERRFVDLAKRHDALAPWLRGGSFER